MPCQYYNQGNCYQLKHIKLGVSFIDTLVKLLAIQKLGVKTSQRNSQKRVKLGAQNMRIQSHSTRFV